MMASSSIILVSTDKSKLICMTEVLKSLMFPFEFQGIIVPYEPRPQHRLLVSKQPYLIGMESEVFDTIKGILSKESPSVFDLDQKEFTTSHHTSKLSCKLSSKNLPSNKKWKFPNSFRNVTKQKLQRKLQTFESGNKNDKEIYIKISELFTSLYIENILDIKNIENIEDFCDIGKMSKKRRKVKEHKEYIETLTSSKIYSEFLKYISKSKNPA